MSEREPPKVIHLLPGETVRLKALLGMPLEELRAQYFAVCGRVPLDEDKPVKTLLSRRTLAELTIWHERPRASRTAGFRELRHAGPRKG